MGAIRERDGQRVIASSAESREAAVDPAVDVSAFPRRSQDDPHVVARAVVDERNRPGIDGDPVQLRRGDAAATVPGVRHGDLELAEPGKDFAVVSEVRLKRAQ